MIHRFQILNLGRTEAAMALRFRGGPEMQVNSGFTRISKIAHVAKHQVNITWADGLSETKDLEPLILNSRELARIKKDNVAFSDMNLTGDGTRVTWSEGETVSARSIFRLPHSAMTTGEFRTAMADLHLTSGALASMLGLSRRAVTNFRTGSPIPKSVALALRYILIAGEI